MHKETAIQLLVNTFDDSFDKERFSKFIKEVFNNFDLTTKNWNVWNEYKDYIDSLDLLGTYEYKKHTIDVLVVKLKKSTSVEKARTMQRNLVAKYLTSTEKDAALVAFYYDGEPDWRFSFVKMEYRLKENDKGKTKIERELTPAKRYSFLVGKYESNHTCKKQFLGLVMEEENIISLEDLESAFSIEKVTNEFFNEYKELYLKLKESLDEILKKDTRVKKEFEEKGISSVDFSKKLLGQIVFIYFLQKKRWLGVRKLEPWGSGPKDFLRKLFNKEITPYENFFNDVLEPLFYEALATSRDEDYYSRFNCKIPFLNGGLFEPIENYNWVATDIVLDNSIFQEILDTFDRYNFTIKEDEPLEKEVAIDPEMLGKVFENLLEISDRKSSGKYYTPREIVHYICQQSLINYVETNTKIPREDVEKFIKFGDIFGSKNDIPDSIIKNIEKIDLLLKNVKVVDPAVGSGAFPVDMMNQIVKTRSVLTQFIPEDERSERTNYNLKRETIENCLYGVDIDSSAIDIAKLRFWLSLIVDEVDMQNIKPLPNLDHKIMVGDSLLEEFEGVKIFDESLLGESMKNGHEAKIIDEKMEKLYLEIGEIHRGLRKYDGNRIKELHKELKKLKLKKKKIFYENKTSEIQITIEDSIENRIKQSRVKLSRLKELQRLFFNEQDRNLKKQYAEQIDRIEWELIVETLKEQGNEESMEKLKRYMKSRSKPFFIWKLYFSEVFQRDNAGFDIVIGNPPYGFRNVLDKEEKEYFRKIEKIEFKSGDSAELFCKKSFNNLTRNGGVLTFIIPKKSLYGDSWDGLRTEYWKKYNLIFLLDVSKAFEKVLLEASVFGLQKIDKQLQKTALAYLNKKDEVVEFAHVERDEVFVANNTAQPYFFKYPKKLIDKIKRNRSEDPFLEGKLGLAIGRPFYSDIKRKYKLLKGIDVEKWRIKQHRYLKNEDKLDKSDLKQFLKPKVIAQRIVAHIENPIPHVKIIATYDEEGIIITNTLMTFELKKQLDPLFWLGYLNSKFVSWYAYNFIYARAIRTMDFYNFYIQQIPIPAISPKEQQSVTKLVNQIISITKDTDYQEDPEKQSKVNDLENKIDHLVYEIYGLTSDEIGIIEGSDF